jgi:hypothetical protein
MLRPRTILWTQPSGNDDDDDEDDDVDDDDVDEVPRAGTGRRRTRPKDLSSSSVHIACLTTEAGTVRVTTISHCLLYMCTIYIFEI